MSDLESLKEVPSYKAILKVILKNQIQYLIEQLSDHAGEDCIVLTANATEGSLSHLGSKKGNQFINTHADIKSRFLGYCLQGDGMNRIHDDSLDYGQFTEPHFGGFDGYDEHEQHGDLRTNSRKRRLNGSLEHQALPHINSTDLDIAVDIVKELAPSENGITSPKDHNKTTGSLFQDECVLPMDNNVESMMGTETLTDKKDMFKMVKTELDDYGPDCSTGGMFSGVVTATDSARVPILLDPAANSDPDVCPTTALSISEDHTNTVLKSANSPTFHGARTKFKKRSPFMKTNRSMGSESLKTVKGIKEEPNTGSESFVDRFGMERHVFTCDVCLRVFNRKYNMVQHRQLHFGIKEFTCNICDKQFTRQDRLKIHCYKYHNMCKM